MSVTGLERVLQGRNKDRGILKRFKRMRKEEDGCHCYMHMTTMNWICVSLVNCKFNNALLFFKVIFQAFLPLLEERAEVRWQGWKDMQQGAQAGAEPRPLQ